MNDALLNLEPSILWRYFARLSEIPRCSKQEERILAWLRAEAAEKDLPTRSDEVGNLVIAVPATPGYEETPTLILQSHVDMVCEKHGSSQHDFTSDPIRIMVQGDRVTADGTTLGADDGIGMATALALLEDQETVHGPLELLFTVDEETGLTGAAGLSPDLLTGSLMINLDAEVVGQFTVGSAGGLDTLIEVPATWTPLQGEEVFVLSISGLRGGHSGGDIHRGRASSIKLLGRILAAALEQGCHGLRLGAMVGGSKRNAIPREAEALVAVLPAQEKRLHGVVDATALEIGRQFADDDPGITIKLRAASAAARAREFAAAEESRHVVDLLEVLPHGVLAMSRQMENLVETSSNVGVLFTDEDGFHLHCSSRSFMEEAIAEVAARMRAAARLAGAVTAHDDGYPGWTPRLDTPLLKRVETVYTDLFGEPPEFIALHGGLECGLIMGKYPSLQIVSYGAKITNAHSPDEWVSVASVQKCWRFTRALVADIAQGAR